MPAAEMEARSGSLGFCKWPGTAEATWPLVTSTLVESGKSFGGAGSNVSTTAVCAVEVGSFGDPS